MRACLENADARERVALVVAARFAGHDVRHRKHGTQSAGQARTPLFEFLHASEHVVRCQLIFRHAVEHPLAERSDEQREHARCAHPQLFAQREDDQVMRHGNAVLVARVERTPDRVRRERVHEHRLHLCVADTRGRELVTVACVAREDVREVCRVPTLMQKREQHVDAAADLTRTCIAREVDLGRGECAGLVTNHESGAVHEAVRVLARAFDEIERQLRAVVADTKSFEGLTPTLHCRAERVVRVDHRRQLALGELAEVLRFTSCGPVFGDDSFDLGLGARQQCSDDLVDHLEQLLLADPLEHLHAHIEVVLVAEHAREMVAHLHQVEEAVVETEPSDRNDPFVRSRAARAIIVAVHHEHEPLVGQRLEFSR